MADTAAFLKEQGRVQEVKPNYGAFVTDDVRAEGDGASSDGALTPFAARTATPCRRSTSAT